MIKFLRKIKILKRIYKSGYVDKEISEQEVVNRIMEDMQVEEEISEEIIQQLFLNNFLLRKKLFDNEEPY